MPALPDNPYLSLEDIPDYFHHDDVLATAFNEAKQACENPSPEYAEIAKYGRRVINSIDRYLTKFNTFTNSPILRSDLTTPLRCVTVLAGGIPSKDYDFIQDLTQNDAIQQCLTAANKFEKQYAGHPIAGTLLAFAGVALCLISAALFCTSAGILSPISVTGFILGNGLIAAAATGAGFVVGVGSTIGGLFLFNRPNHISRALLKLNKEANRAAHALEPGH